MQQVLIGALGRRRGCVVFDEIAEFAVFFLANWMLQAERTPAYLKHPLDLAWFKMHFSGNFFRRWFTPMFLLKLTSSLVQVTDSVRHVDRYADSTALVGNGARDRLANPPRCVGTEAVAARVIELFDGLHET